MRRVVNVDVVRVMGWGLLVDFIGRLGFIFRWVFSRVGFEGVVLWFYFSDIFFCYLERRLFYS